MGYSRVTRVGPHVSVTGTIALDDDGNPVKGDAGAQTRRVLAILERALRRVGATPDDVVRTRIFVTDIARDWEAVGRAHGEVFGVLRPATTMVEVSALIEPWARVEIEVDAILGGSPVRDAPEVTIHGADGSALTALLDAAGLPHADPEAAIWIAKDSSGTIVGGASTVAIGADALLRSCVVADAARRRGIGAPLVDSALLRAAAAGAERAYLATESAAPFFATLGFVSIPELPTAIAERLPHDCHQASTMARVLR